MAKRIEISEILDKRMDSCLFSIINEAVMAETPNKTSV